DKQVRELKDYARIAADPAKALKSKDAGDRFKAAATLIFRYRTSRGTDKTEQIPAEESKRILEALAETDWNVQVTQPGQITAQALFQMLQPEQGGWKYPEGVPFQQVPAMMKSWVKENVSTFRVQRFIDAPADK